jgi:hypothetical protein
MTTTIIQEELQKKFQSSPTFSQLPSDQKAKIRQQYLNASDEQALNALKALESADKNYIVAQEKRKEAEQKKIQLTEVILIETKNLEKVSLKSKEKKEEQNSDKVLSQLETDLEGLNPKPKRKKWFGIF